MDFLALCKRTVRECGIAGSGPTTVIDQSSMLEKVVGWVDQAWNDIQLDQPTWLFMRKEFLFNTTANQRDYTAIAAGINDLKYWDTGSFLIYDTAIGESDQSKLYFRDYLKWRAQYRARMNTRDNERPILITQMPDNSIRFEPRPDKDYTIEGDYRRSTQVFTLNTDEPTGLPEDLHMIIVWKAVMTFADDQNAPDLLDKAEAGYDPLYHRMLIEQLPKFNEDYEALA